MKIAPRWWGKHPGSAGHPCLRSQDVCLDSFDAVFGENQANCRFAQSLLRKMIMKTGTRISLAAVSVLLTLFIAFAVYGQRRDAADDRAGGTETQWEYLVVSGGSSNLSTSGNENYPRQRKQPDDSFNREYFPLERNFDKLGAKGWELVSVYGSSNDPVYFFKRVKESK
jgi:hypothetical protein